MAVSPEVLQQFPFLAGVSDPALQDILSKIATGQIPDYAAYGALAQFLQPQYPNAPGFTPRPAGAGELQPTLDALYGQGAAGFQSRSGVASGQTDQVFFPDQPGQFYGFDSEGNLLTTPPQSPQFDNQGNIIQQPAAPPVGSVSPGDQSELDALGRAFPSQPDNSKFTALDALELFGPVALAAAAPAFAAGGGAADSGAGFAAGTSADAGIVPGSVGAASSGGAAALGAGATVAPSAAIQASSQQTADVLGDTISPTADTAATTGSTPIQFVNGEPIATSGQTAVNFSGGQPFAFSPAGAAPPAGPGVDLGALGGAAAGDTTVSSLGLPDSQSTNPTGQPDTGGQTTTTDVAGESIGETLNAPLEDIGGGDQLSTVLGSSSTGPLGGTPFSPPDPAAVSEIGAGDSAPDLTGGDDGFDYDPAQGPPPVKPPVPATGIFDKALNFVSNNPFTTAKLALGGAALGTSLARGQQKLPGSATALENEGNSLNATAQNLIGQANSGQLTAGQIAQIQAQRQQSLAQIYQQLASQGVADPTKDTRYIMAAQQIESNAQAQTQKFLDATLQDGLAAAGQASQALAGAAQLELARDAEFQKSLNAALSALGLASTFAKAA